MFDREPNRRGAINRAPTKISGYGNNEPNFRDTTLTLDAHIVFSHSRIILVENTREERAMRATPIMAAEEKAARMIDGINPATLEVIGKVPEWSDEMVIAAIGRAKAVQPAWAALGFWGRARYLQRVQGLLSERAEDLARTITLNNGKPLIESLSSDIIPVLYLLRYFLKQGGKLLRPEPVDRAALREIMMSLA